VVPLNAGHSEAVLEGVAVDVELEVVPIIPAEDAKPTELDALLEVVDVTELLDSEPAPATLTAAFVAPSYCILPCEVLT